MQTVKDIISDAKALAALYVPTWAGISAGIDRSGVPTMHVATPSLRQQLKEIDAELSDKRNERADRAKTRDEAKEVFAKAEDKSSSGEPFQKAQAAVAGLGEVEDGIASLRETQEMTLRLLGEDPETRPAGDPRDPRSEGWDSGRLFEDEEQRKQLLYQSTSQNKMGGIELGQIIGRDALAAAFGAPQAADVEPTGPMRRGAFRGIVPQLRRPLSLLDLVPTGTMDLNTFPFVREEGSLTGTAKGVKEGVTKPEGGFTFVDDEAVARTIAEFMKIKKQALADVPALRSVIDSRLRYAIERKLENEVLAGKGVDPELKGILEATGIGIVKWVDKSLVADQTLTALTQIFLANAHATGIVMNPVDWQGVLEAKAGPGPEGSGDLQYYSGGPFRATPQIMWGIPLIPAAAIPAGTVLVGDFTIGVQLLIREGINVLMSDSDQDDFIKNRVTLLGEMRAANVVWRPAAFSKVYLTKAAEDTPV